MTRKQIESKIKMEANSLDIPDLKQQILANVPNRQVVVENKKTKEAKKIVSETARYMANFGNTAEELAMLKIGKDTDVKNIINAFFKIKENDTDRQINQINKQREGLYQAYKADDNANFTGTVWGLVNGFSDYITHKEVKNTKNKDEGKFMSVTFDPVIFSQFLNHVKSFA